MGCGSSRAANVEAAADNFAAVSAQFVVGDAPECEKGDKAAVEAALAAFVAEATIKSLEKDKEFFGVAKGDEAQAKVQAVIDALKEKTEEADFQAALWEQYKTVDAFRAGVQAAALKKALKKDLGNAKHFEKVQGYLEAFVNAEKAKAEDKAHFFAVYVDDDGIKELEGLKGKEDKVTFPCLVRHKDSEADAIAAADGVKESGKVVLFTYFGKSHDGHESVSNKVTEFTAAEGEKPAKVVLGTAAPAAPAAPDAPAEAAVEAA